MTSELAGNTAFWASVSFTLAVVMVQTTYTSVSVIIRRNVPLYAVFFLFAIGFMVFAVARSMFVFISG